MFKRYFDDNVQLLDFLDETKIFAVSSLTRGNLEDIEFKLESRDFVDQDSMVKHE